MQPTLSNGPNEYSAAKKAHGESSYTPTAIRNSIGGGNSIKRIEEVSFPERNNSTDRNAELQYELNKQMRNMAPPAPSNAKILNGQAHKLTQLQYETQLKAACERNEHFPNKMTTSKERRPNQ